MRVASKSIDVVALARGATVAPAGVVVATVLRISDPLTAVLVRASFEGWKKS